MAGYRVRSSDIKMRALSMKQGLPFACDGEDVRWNLSKTIFEFVSFMHFFFDDVYGCHISNDSPYHHPLLLLQRFVIIIE
jgi:hypothetical protein